MAARPQLRLAARPVMRVGVQDDGTVLANPQLAIQRAQQLGARNFRVIVRGTRGLDAYDPAIRLAHQAGMNVQVTLTDYKDPSFARQAMARWKGLVGTWSPWNEPDLTGVSVGQYRQLFRHLRIAQAKTGTRAQLLEGEVSPLRGGVQYARRLGRLKGAAGLAVHPYNNAPRVEPGGIGHLGRYRTHKYRKLPIYVSEYGVPGSTPNDAAQMRQALTDAQRFGAREFIAYHVSPKDPTSQWDTGLMAPDGSKRPDYYVLKNAIRNQNVRLARRKR